MYSKYTVEEEQYIRDHINKITISEIASNLNRGYEATKAHIHRMGLHAGVVKNAPWTAKDDEILRSCFEYETKSQIQAKFPDRTWGAILQHGKKMLGLNRVNQNRYSVDYDFFSEWTEESSYFFGFIMADGHVAHGKENNCIQIAVAERDRDILEKFKQCTNFEGPITKGSEEKHNINISKNYLSNVQKGIRITIANKKMVYDLFDMGLPMERKTYTANFPSHIPKEMKRHFIRGLIDGDGWVSVVKRGYVSLGLVGTENILYGVRDSYPYDCSMNAVRHKGKNFWDLIINGRKAMKILDWLYGDASVYLNRKYDKYLEAKELYELKNSPLQEKSCRDTVLKPVTPQELRHQKQG